MNWKHFVPLAGFAIPTVLIGYGLVIPHSCIAGWNALSVGFATTILSACVAYCSGIRSALRTPLAKEKKHAPA